MSLVRSVRGRLVGLRAGGLVGGRSVGVAWPPCAIQLGPNLDATWHSTWSHLDLVRIRFWAESPTRSLRSTVRSTGATQARRDSPVDYLGTFLTTTRTLYLQSSFQGKMSQRLQPTEPHNTTLRRQKVSSNTNKSKSKSKEERETADKD